MPYRLLSTLLLASFIAPANAQEARIINGKPASTVMYPWMASLSISGTGGVGGSFGCGGSLIAANWVLSAAHCFLNNSNDAVDYNLAQTTTVTVKSDNNNTLSPDAISVKGTRLIIHPNYDPVSSTNRNDNDIALLELAQPVSGVAFAILHDSVGPNLVDGSTLTVMGWGGIVPDASKSSELLLQVNQRYTANSECSQMMGGGITDNMLCAAGLTTTDTSDSCQGDSGGPIFMTHNNAAIVVGLSSFGGSPCGNTAEAGVYTRVANYQSFISQYVPQAVFSTASTSATMPNCGGTGLDSAINIGMSCLQIGDTVYATSLQFNSASGQWQFGGHIAPLSCSPVSSTCATVDANLNLRLPGIRLAETLYNVELNFAGDANSLRWNFGKFY